MASGYDILNGIVNKTAEITSGYYLGKEQQTSSVFLTFNTKYLSEWKKAGDTFGLFGDVKYNINKICPILRGDIKWSLSFGNDFSSSPIPVGVEKANYICSSLKTISLSFSISDLEIEFENPTRLNDLISNVIIGSKMLGITDGINALIPQSLKNNLSSFRQRIININSKVAGAVIAEKNIQNASNYLFNEENNNNNIIKEFLDLLSHSIENHDFIDISINGRLYTNMLITKASSIDGNTSYSNKIANFNLVFKEVDRVEF